MSYVDKNLMADEQVVYKTKRHWVIFGWPIFFLCLGILLFAGGRMWSGEEVATNVGIAALFLAVFIALITAIPAWINRSTSEFAVTNRRVIMKIGWIRRRSLETLLMKVEGIQVEQGILGRVLNYGTITITGTGGSREVFDRIAAPLEFRRKVQEQTVATQGSR